MHERVDERVAARVGDLVHTSLQPTFDLVQEGHAPGMCQLGNADLWAAGSREVSRGSAEQSALDNQGGGSGTWEAPRRRGALLMLAEVQCRSANID